MALFNAMRGDSSRLGDVEFTDGRVYLTTDDENLFIDAIDDSGNEKRIHINKNSEGTVVYGTLTAANWSLDKTQSVTLNGITATSNGWVGVSNNATDSQYGAAAVACMRPVAQGANYVTIKCDGDVPTVDIPVMAIIPNVVTHPQEYINKQGQIKYTTISLPTASWTASGNDFTQTVSISGYTVTARTQVDLQESPAILTQLVNDKVNGLIIENNNGAVIATAVGAKPSVDIAAQVTLKEVVPV